MNNRYFRLGVSMPGVNQPMHRFGEMAKIAEESGFDSVWGYEAYRNGFVQQATSAVTTSKIDLAIGLAAAAQRSPFEMSNAAMDVNELSNGRLRLVIGPGGASFNEFFNGVEIDRPATRMREYIKIMKMYLEHARSGAQFDFEGEFYKFCIPPMNPFGQRPFPMPDFPLYLGAIQPAMLRLAGELCDGIMGFLPTPELMKNHLIPGLAEGATKANRDQDEVDIVQYIICSPHEDRETALYRARIQVGTYVCHPLGDFVLKRDGLLGERDKVMAGLMEGGPPALAECVPDVLLERYAVVGTPGECREQFKYYQEFVPHAVLHTPYVPPLKEEESYDTYVRICKTFAR